MRKLNWMLAVALVACAIGGFAIGIAWATPGRGITSTTIVGPVRLGEGHVKSESDVNEIEFEAQRASDLYVVHNKIVPGGHTGWHSHPGISFVMVRAGTLSEYHEDDPNAEPTVYSAGTCLVEPAGRVHLLANEGETDLELVAFQIIPRGAPRRIDADQP
jgi:quercetin dioxygenase-like cupin family protein